MIEDQLAKFVKLPALIHKFNYEYMGPEYFILKEDVKELKKWLIEYELNSK